MSRLTLTPEQEAEALGRYQIGLDAGRKALKLTPEILSLKHDIGVRSIRRMVGKGLAYTLGSAAYQDIPHDALIALWDDISNRDRQRSIHAEYSAKIIADNLGVCPIQLQSRMDYLTNKRILRRQPMKDRESETPDFVRGFLFMPAINPGQSLGYYGHG